MKPRLSKPKDAERKDAKPVLYADKEFEGDFPHLFSFITQGVWEDGTARQLGTLLFFVDGGVLKLCLNDRELNRSAFVSGATFAAALASAEDGMLDGSLDWRQKK